MSKSKQSAAKPSQAQQRKAEERRKQLARANVDADPRTAMGQREFTVTGVGKNTRVQIDHLSECLKRKADRTLARTMAWTQIDYLQNRVHAGDLKSPKFEASVDVSTIPAMAEDKMRAKAEDAELRAFLGHESHYLVVQVVFWRKSLTEMAHRYEGGQRQASMLFKLALDQAAMFFGVDKYGAQNRSRNLRAATQGA